LTPVKIAEKEESLQPNLSEKKIENKAEIIEEKKSDANKEEEGSYELFIKNFKFSQTETSLSTFFVQFGKVNRVRILTNKNDGTSKGRGFIEFSKMDEAKKALETCKSLKLDGRDLQVEYSRQKSNVKLVKGNKDEILNGDKNGNKKEEIKKETKPLKFHYLE